MASFCPYCNAPNCYNSGFTIECINEQCKFFSKKQKDFCEEERKKIVPPVSTRINEKEEVEEDIDYF